jgi:RNA polymerase sigma factor (sigma-70 family)
MLKSVTYDENKLLLLLSEDSSYAFQIIYDKHKNNIYQIALRTLKSPLLAQEVVQDVFLKLWFERKNAASFHSLENWLFIVAKNHMLNQLKKIAKEWQHFNTYTAETENQFELPNEDSEIDKLYYTQLHDKALDSLTQHQKNVYVLVRLKNLSYIQTANLLKISPLTVKKHMNRALLGIRKFIKNSGFKSFFFFV